MTTQTIPAPIQIAQALFDAISNRGRLVSHSETVWTSATHSGPQDVFTIRFDGPHARFYADMLCDKVDEDRVPIPGALVVELTAKTMPYAQDHIDVVVTALTLANDAQDTCPIHRQPVTRCPGTCDHGRQWS